MSAQDDACVTGGGEVPENIFNMLQDQCAAHVDPPHIDT